MALCTLRKHLNQPSIALMLYEIMCSAVKLMKFIFSTSYDLNAKDDNGWTAFHFAAAHGYANKDMVLSMIKSSQDFSIDLNARDDFGNTAINCINSIKVSIFHSHSKIGAE